MLTMVVLLTFCNEVMERILLPRKLRREEGEKYKYMVEATVPLILHPDEVRDLTSDLCSSKKKASLVLEGMRRNTAFQGNF